MKSLFSVLSLALAVLTIACSAPANSGSGATPDERQAMQTLDAAVADTAVFAGGCFWCMEPPFDEIDGVVATISGYAGGTVENPTYQQVVTKTTGHAEVLQVIYDADKVSYETLLNVYWRNVDPFDGGGQFCDRGSPYRPVIFPANAEQRALAESSYGEVDARFTQPLAVEITDLETFYPAEDYHQNFYKTNPQRYYSYRTGCRRDARLQQVWGDEAGGAMFAATDG
ncbi:MAG: peptide-methionine (S)-S-oxide reductase MsrA [Bacteroidota bacterium]